MLHRCRPLIAAVVLFLAGFGLVACGDDEGDNDAADSTTTTEEAGAQSVTLDMQDYSYAVSGAVVEGGSLEVKNTGNEFHMAVMSKLVDDKTIDDVSDALNSGDMAGDDEGSVTTVSSPSAATTTPGTDDEQDAGPFEGILEEGTETGFMMSPGESAKITGLKLEQGTYAMICYLNTEGTGEPHFQKGMLGELTVTDGEAPEPPKPTATITLGNKKATASPTTLPAGPAVIELKREGGEHEGLVAKPAAGRTFAQLDAYFTREFEGDDPPTAGAGKNAPGSIPVFLFDQQGSVFIELNLTAGTYYFACALRDNENDESSPTHSDQGEMVRLTVT